MANNIKDEEKSLELHKKLQGKVEIKAKIKITKENLRYLYTPGVANVVNAISYDKNKIYDYTWKSNTIAIVSDGSRILGLGNLGAEAALPVMEGKSLLFKEYGGVNAIPLCIKSQDAQEIIKFIQNVSPVFGAINLEDIESPKCLDIFEYLTNNLGIPIFHDDQHGIAIVVLAALTNALKLAKKSLHSSKIVVLGAGAAGYGIANLLYHAGARHIIILDNQGIIYSGRENLNFYKQKLAKLSNLYHESGNLPDALKGADACISVSGKKDIISGNLVKSMNKNPIVFALSNPEPEIIPSEAKRAGAFITATGSSAYENQVNNSLVFPFLMRKILRERIPKLSQQLYISTAMKIASKVKNLSSRNILPSLDEMKKIKL